MEQGPGWRIERRDIVLALAFAGYLAAAAPLAREAGTRLDVLAYLLLVTSALVLAARRRAPAVVLVVVTACVFAYQVRGYPHEEVAALPVLIAVYTGVRAGHRWLTLAVTGSALVVGALVSSPVGDETSRDFLERRFLIIGWVVAAGVLAEVSRQREAYVREVEERAAEAERTREETARRRAGEERLRIARELHDSLTHSISVIKVQAGVAIHLARKRGEEVPEALLAIQEASRDATRELRATLQVLRTDPMDSTESGGDEASASGLDRLDDLVERARTAGVPASVTIEGDERPLPPAVDRAAYRIIQEALTNVGRHAGPATADVRLDYGPGLVTVQIDDDGRATPDAPPVPGTGLIGMRERVTALGGRLRAEPRPGGGFTVRAELPAAGNSSNNNSNGAGAQARSDGATVPAESPADGNGSGP
jgi:signal transduction histidine kinase